MSEGFRRFSAVEIEGVEAADRPTAADAALDGFTSALDQLIDVTDGGGLDGYDGLQLVNFLQRFEQARNRAALIDHRALRAAETVRLPETIGQPNLKTVLTWALRLSPAEAARRVRAAEAVGERVTMTGARLAPARATLAQVQRDGQTSPEQLDICLRALDKVDHRGFDPADLDAADRLLAQFASTFAPKELRLLAAQVIERIDPDGTRPRDDLNADRRHLTLRPMRDGTYSLEGRLTGALGAKLNAVLGPLAKPRPKTVAVDDGREVNEPDPRHHTQRMHDALEEVCDRLLRSGSLPDTGGTPATVIITIPEHDLTARQRWGVTSDGTALSADTVTDLAGEADVYPTVIDSTGVVLQAGRTRRLATPGQTVALIVRDGGCSFPGCDRPPEWCERHHIVEWAQGGRTDLDNLTLLCAYHHHNFASRGWTCRMIDGLPAWIPPRWVDREQRPLRHARITARQRGQTLRL